MYRRIWSLVVICSVRSLSNPVESSAGVKCSVECITREVCIIRLSCAWDDKRGFSPLGFAAPPLYSLQSMTLVCDFEAYHQPPSGGRRLMVLPVCHKVRRGWKSRILSCVPLSPAVSFSLPPQISVNLVVVACTKSFVPLLTVCCLLVERVNHTVGTPVELRLIRHFSGGLC